MNRKIPLTVGLLLVQAAFVGVSLGQLSPQEKYEREIIVEFRRGVIQMPVGDISIPPNKPYILAPSVAEVMETYKAELIFIAFPDCDPVDTIAISPTGKLVKKPNVSQIYKVRFPTGTNLDAVVKKLLALPDVVYAERTPRYEYYVIPDDDYFDNQWALHDTGQAGGTPDADIDAPEAWNIAKGSSSIKIGILDSGIDEDHEDLVGKTSGDAGYSYYHGTHVAGIAGAKTDNDTGIAGVNWYTLLHDEDLGYPFDPDRVYPAVISAVDAGCHVLNNSWGGVRLLDHRETCFCLCL